MLHLYIQKDTSSSSIEEVTETTPKTTQQKLLPYIAADLIIPRLNYRMKHFEKIIPFHTLIGENVPPAEIYANLVTYFVQQKLSFLYHCLQQTIHLKRFHGTVVEVSNVYTSIYCLLFLMIS